MIIYGIKTCSSVQKAIKYFKENNLDFTFHDIRKEPLNDQIINNFHDHIDINLLFNSRGTKYRQLGLKELNLNDSEKLVWLKKESMLLKRPIITYNNNALCGFNEKIYDKEFM